MVKSGNKWLGVTICGVMWLKVVYVGYFFWIFFHKMAAVGHFGCPKFTLDRISGHFRSIGHFGFPKFTFDRNSGHFRSIQNFIGFFSVVILDVRKSLSIAFLAISDRSALLDVQNSF